MAAKDDSKKSLIIILVIFVVLSLGLGVTTYYGFAGQNALAAQAAEAGKKEAAKTKARDWEQFQRLTLKAYLGWPMTKEERESIGSLRQGFDGGSLGKDEPNRADFDNLLKKMSEDLHTQWDDAKKQPKDTYIATVDRLDTEVKNLRIDLQKTNERLEKTKNDLEAKLRDSEAEKDETLKALQTAKKELADTIKDKSAELLKVLKQVDDLQQQNEELQKRAEEVKDLTKRDTEKSQRKIRELTIQRDRLKSLESPESNVDLAQPKGKVVNVDRRGSTVYISVGSDEGVRPPLTFSIYSADGNGKAVGDRKGALEVVSAVAPHISMARVTDVTDPGRKPIVAGDLIFNPAWSPGLKQHVALAGAIDLTGEGKDDTVQFMRDLDRMGLTVDSYLDLKDLQVKGRGMGPQTSFLVLGDQPEFSEQQSIREQGGRRNEILKKIGEMQAEATSNGIPIVPLRRFLGIIGYPLPKGTAKPGSFYDSLPPGKAPAADSGDKKDDSTDKDK
jgi:hypothetical protein